MKYLLIIVIAIFGLATVTFGQTIPSYVPTNGLVGWWPFNGNANDESGNGNNGTVTGASLAIDRLGNSNSAYSFDGSTNYIQCQNAGPTGNPVITFTCWIKTASTNYGNIISYGGNSQSGQDFRVFINGNCPNSFAFDTYDNQKAKVTSYNNSWDFYCVIYNGDLGNNTTVASFYKNGILMITECFNVNISSTNISNLIPITFGKYHGTIPANPPGFYDGILDDIGIWNRALTEQEISNLYNAVNCSNSLSINLLSNQLATGSTAIFTATTSDLNPSYIWQSDLGQGFQTLNNYGNYSGVNTNSLSISNVQLPNHTQPIRVISTSGECIDTSNVATINIIDTCIVTINDTITTLISVTDTLVINTLITGLTPPNNSNTIKVFPNPSNSHITIDFGNFESMNSYTLTITNSIGQTVYTTPINEQSSYIDLSTWGGNGIYFVQIIDTLNNTIENRKIVLQ
jgi:hypothetical protein